MMECIEARALKPSFLSQMATTMTMSPHHHHHHHHHHVFYNDDDDVLCFTGINGAEDNFPVEDLLNLDFPEEVKEGCINLQEHQEEEEEEDSQKRDYSSNNSSSPTFSEFDSLPAGELAVPVDDLENLEWLSQFVDDSTADLSLLYPTGSFSDKNCANPSNRFEPAKKPVKKVRAPCFPLPAPGKARTKRSKPNKRQWSMASLPSSAAENSSSTTSSSYGSSTLPPPALMRSVHDTDWFITSAEKPVVKKQKRKPEGVENGVISGRKCSHCQVQKTPQWRTGPLGPKTLCNACGVRFKSGRLYPEYRPACSPTFLQEMHSNSHRKVLEMRRKKETTAGVAELDLASEVLIEPVVSRPVQTELQSSRCVYEPVADGIVQF